MVRFLSKNFPRSFWNEDKGLTSIFILLCISNFLIIPFFAHQGALIHMLSRIIWFILLVAGITTLAQNRMQMRKFSIIPILLIIVTVLLAFVENKFLNYIEFTVDLAVFGLLIVMVLVKVFEGGSVTVHRIIGSIVVYMLIGDVFAQIYQFIYANSQTAIQFTAADKETGVSTASFLYFSFTTLTTTGFGDILPVSTVTRTVLIIEQLVGVLYPVVLIGRLVSLVSGDIEKSMDGK